MLAFSLCLRLVYIGWPCRASWGVGLANGSETWCRARCRRKVFRLFFGPGGSAIFGLPGPAPYPRDIVTGLRQPLIFGFCFVFILIYLCGFGILGIVVLVFAFGVIWCLWVGVYFILKPWGELSYLEFFWEFENICSVSV